MLKKSLIAALFTIGGLHGVSAIAASAAPLAPVTPVTPLAAKQASPLSVELTVKKIILKDEKELRADAANAAPGDVLEYRAEYKNIGAVTLSKALLTLPLPDHTTYIDGSAYPAGMTASNRNAIADFKSPPLLQQAPGDAIGALRWATNKLTPGQTVTVSMRVRVNAADADNAAAPQTPAEEKERGAK
jgi:uncharacterized repeat protein (TIGR01451 family)